MKDVRIDAHKNLYMKYLRCSYRPKKEREKKMHKMKQESKQEGKKESTFPEIKIAMLTLMRYLQDNQLNISKRLKP